MTSAKSRISARLGQTSIDYSHPSYRCGVKYSPQTGLFMRDYPRKGWRPVTTKNSNGYVTIFYEKRKLLAHRLAFYMMGKTVPPDMVVDHINGIKSDNRWENLRIVTNRENQTNRKRHRNGSLPGAFYFKRDNRWAAQISINRKSIHLGYFDTEMLAHEAYNRAKSKLANQSLGEIRSAK